MAAPGAWYRLGRVGVTFGSATVTGVNTNWILSPTPPLAGDLFSIDNSVFYEVINVVSDTEITLERAFEAPSNADTPYAIIRNTSATINSRLAAQVTKALNQKQKMIDDQNNWLVSTNPTEKFTDGLGNEQEVKTPFQMDQDVAKMRQDVDDKITEADNAFIRAMTKATFDANREQRKREYAGSGYAEWGKTLATSGTVSAINEGLHTTGGAISSLQGQLALGQSTATGNPVFGVSRTNNPIAVVDGVNIHIEGVNATVGTDYASRIEFPPAPDGTKTYDSATGVVTQHATTNEAFEGNFTNGDFRNGTADWQITSGAGFTVANGIATLTSAGSGQDRIEQNLSGVYPNGSVIVFEASIYVPVGSRCIFQQYDSGGSVNIEIPPNGKMQRYSITQAVVDSSSYYPQIQCTSATGTTIEIASCSHRLQSESVITDRKDLVFLETWHEVIGTGSGEKDIVFPFGNVQYGSALYNSIGVFDYSAVHGGGQGYCAFGEWDASTDGKASKWSTISEDERKTYLEDPRNNIYYDAVTNKLVQVRYRIRTIEGLGNDWANVRNTLIGSTWSKNSLNYDTKSLVTPKAANETIPSDLGGYVAEQGMFLNHSTSQLFLNPESRGTWRVYGGGLSGSYNFKINAIPIALVQRLNQGVYSPEFNGGGCGKIRNSANTAWLNWQEDPALIKSKADCFDFQVGVGGKPNNNLSGRIATNTGRFDQYASYDGVYAGQIEDLRLSANKQDTNKLLEDSIRKSVSGDMRGKGKVPFTIVTDLGLHTNVEYFANLVTRGIFASNSFRYTMRGLSNESRLSKDDIPYCGYIYGKSSGLIYPVKETVKDTGLASEVYIPNVDSRSDFNTETTGWILVQGDYNVMPEGAYSPTTDFPFLTSEFDSLPYVNLVGDPARIAATVPSGVVGEWIPQIPDGTSKEFIFTRKLNSSKVQQTYTENNGATWTSNNPNIDTVKNSITFLANSSLVALYQQESFSNFTEIADRGAITGTIGNVWYGSAPEVNIGNRLQPSLTGGIGKSYGAFYFGRLSVTSMPIEDSGRFFLSEDFAPRHTPIDAGSPTNDSSMVKALCTLTEKNGLLYMQYHGRELKNLSATAVQITSSNLDTDAVKGTTYKVAHDSGTVMDGGLYVCVGSFGASWDNAAFYKAGDGSIKGITGIVHLKPVDISSWGDDSKIPIINGEGTMTDDNGNTVKTFCHHLQIPIGIADYTDSSQS